MFVCVFVFGIKSSHGHCHHGCQTDATFWRKHIAVVNGIHLHTGYSLQTWRCNCMFKFVKGNYRTSKFKGMSTSITCWEVCFYCCSKCLNFIKIIELFFLYLNVSGTFERSKSMKNSVVKLNHFCKFCLQWYNGCHRKWCYT